MSYGRYGQTQIPITYQQPQPMHHDDNPTDHERDRENRKILYVTGVPIGLADELEGRFDEYEGMVSCYQPQGKRYMFVEYDNEQSAKEAKDEMNGISYGEARLHIEYGKGAGDPRFRGDRDYPSRGEGRGRYGGEYQHIEPTRMLWIGGLQSNDAFIIPQFFRFGMIDRVRIVRQKGCANIEYKDLETAKRAYMELQTVLRNQGVRLDYAKEPLQQSYPWYPEMPSEMLKSSFLPPKKWDSKDDAVISDTTRKIIDELVPYLLEHGVLFEEMVKDKCKGDKHFSFMFNTGRTEDEALNDYYRWRLYDATMRKNNLEPYPAAEEDESVDDIPPWLQNAEDEGMEVEDSRTAEANDEAPVRT